MASRPWEPGEKLDAVISSVGLLTIVEAGLFLARRNLLRGSGDRPGAFRLALLVFGSFVLSWAFGADHQPTFAEVGLLFRQIAWALLSAAITWLAYIALEPYARKVWPEIVVSWSRLIRGRWRDPLVGRDVLIGFASCFVSIYLELTGSLLERWLDLPSDGPTPVWLSGLTGVRQSLARDFQIPSIVFGETVVLVFVLLLLRVILRKSWAAAATLVLLLALPWVAGARNPALSAPLAFFAFGLFVFVLVRYGFLAAVANVFLAYAGQWQVHTADLSAWYAGRSCSSWPSLPQSSSTRSGSPSPDVRSFGAPCSTARPWLGRRRDRGDPRGRTDPPECSSQCGERLPASDRRRRESNPYPPVIVTW